MTSALTSKPATKLNTALVLLLLIVCLLIALYFYYGDKNYLAIPLADIPAEDYLVANFHEETYVIVKVPTALSSMPENAIADTSASNVRVFSLSMQQGYMMLPSKKQQSYKLPCMQFEYIPKVFIHDDEEVSGGFKCTYSVSPKWEDNLVYNLQGTNLNYSMGSLYVPQHYVINGELRVGISQQIY